MNDPDKVTLMFNRIAPFYDRLNRILSLGIDLLWRKKMRRFLPKGFSLVCLDLATGTGDQILAFKGTPHIASFLGIDLSLEMMQIAKRKCESMNFPIAFQMGSALALPLENESIDFTSMSFGIRNIHDPLTCLKEVARCLKPSGRVALLEFSMPQNRVCRFFYLLHLRHILPKLGGLFSKDPAAYLYLNKSIEAFPSGDAFLAIMREAGLKNLQAYPMSFGIVTLYIGEK